MKKDIPASGDHGLPTDVAGPRIPGGCCWHDWGFRWLDSEQAYECKACGMKVKESTWLKYNPDMKFE